MGIPEPPKHIKESFRLAFLEGENSGLLNADFAKSEFNDLRRYILAMETLIDNQEKSEIKATIRATLPHLARLDNTKLAAINHG